MPPITAKQRIIQDLTRRIRSGEYAPGAKIPSGRELRAEYDTSQTTVNAAVEWLKATGLLQGVPGSGWYVVDVLPPDA